MNFLKRFLLKRSDRKPMVCGEGNELVNLPRKCKVIIFGDRNRVEFVGERKTFPCTIIIGFTDCRTDDCRVVIGERTVTRAGLSIELFESGSEVVIGSDCLFSNNVSIRCSDSHAILDADGNLLNRGRFVRIGDKCWLGHGVTVLKNVELPEGTVVGINSTVARLHDIEPRCAIAGNPARVVKRGVFWVEDHPQDILDHRAFTRSVNT